MIEACALHHRACHRAASMQPAPTVVTGASESPWRAPAPAVLRVAGGFGPGLSTVSGPGLQWRRWAWPVPALYCSRARGVGCVNPCACSEARGGSFEESELQQGWAVNDGCRSAWYVPSPHLPLCRIVLIRGMSLQAVPRLDVRRTPDGRRGGEARA
jgi:hypothetical protein